MNRCLSLILLLTLTGLLIHFKFRRESRTGEEEMNMYSIKEFTKGNFNWIANESFYTISEGGNKMNILKFINSIGTAWWDFKMLFSGEEDTTEGIRNPFYKMNNRTEVFSKEKLEKDFNEMVSYLKIHPGLYEFTTQTTFDSLCESQFAAIKDSMTANEFYALCSAVVAKVGCYHTVLHYPYTDLSPSTSFPLAVYYDQNRMFVSVYNRKVPDISAGSEIIEINGNSVTDIYLKISNSISTDGYNQAGKQRLLNKSFHDYYSIFYGPQNSYTVTYKPYKETEIKTATFSGGIAPHLDNPRKEGYKCRDYNLCFALYEEKNTAVISVKSFSYYSSVGYFRSFIDECFDAIREKNIGNVIFDHRDGVGGDPYCSSHLLAYLIDKPVTYFTKDILIYDPLKVPLKPVKHAYKGKVFVLIDNGGFSTSGHLNALIKHHKLATFIGQETGATYSCHAAVKGFTLKHTRLGLEVARAPFTVDVQSLPNDRGILPDYEVVPTPEDIVEGNDPVMDFAMKLIENR